MADDQAGGELGQVLRAGLLISQVSFAWTIVAGGAAITIGALGNSLVLITFGLIGLLDAVGSGSLIVHFHHSLRHQVISERHEGVALVIVTVGMAAIGVATIADSGYRLSAHAISKALPPGIALAVVSVVVLAALATIKGRIAERIPSPALHADGWLSAIGSILAFVVLAGSALNELLNWWWLDSVAAIAVGCGALGMSLVLAWEPS